MTYSLQNASLIFVVRYKKVRINLCSMDDKEYYAFISYKSEDVEWATWLQHELEHYHLPASFNGRTDVPHELHPVFRDIDELSAGNLPEQIKRALANSQNLIVICSPQAAQSPWVNQEVESFISLGRTNRIFPFIVEGNSPSEFFPPALRDLPKDEERLGGDVSKKGRDAAFVKVVAGMLGVGFDSLWNRYEKEKAEEERKQREQRDKLLIAQSRFLAEKSISLIDEGDAYTARLLALEALPRNISNPDRPYVVDAEIALRKACSNECRLFNGHGGSITYLAISPDGKLLASASLDNHIRLWDIHSGRCVANIKKKNIVEGKFRSELLDGLIDEMECIGFASVEFSPDGKYLLAVGNDATIYLWDVYSNKQISEWSNDEIYLRFLYATFSPNMDNIISVGYCVPLDENMPGVSGLRTWSMEEKLSTDLIESFVDYEYISYSPNGDIFACVTNGQVEVWDSYLKKRLFVLTEQKDEMTSYKGMTKFSPNGQYLAFSVVDRIRIWDLKSRKLLQTILNQSSIINCIAYTPDSKYIISGGMDKIVSFWDLEDGQCVRKLKGHTGNINTIAVSKDGNFVISAGDDYRIRLWSIKNSQHLSPVTTQENMLKKGVNKVIYESGEDRTYYDEGRNIIFINGVKGDIDFGVKNPHFSSIRHLALSPDGNNLLSISCDNVFYICRNLSALKDIAEKHINPQQQTYRIEVFSIEDQDLLVFKGHSDRLVWASYSSDGTHVVSCSEDGTIRIWEVLSGRCVYVFEDIKERITHVEFAPDGLHIISKSDEGKIQAWYYPLLQQLINDTREQFKERVFTAEERNKYYLV